MRLGYNQQHIINSGLTLLSSPPSSFFSTDCSEAVPLLQFFYHSSVVSYVTFVLTLFVPHLTREGCAYFLGICTYILNSFEDFCVTK